MQLGVSLLVLFFFRILADVPASEIGIAVAVPFNSLLYPPAN